MKKHIKDIYTTLDRIYIENNRVMYKDHIGVGGVEAVDIWCKNTMRNKKSVYYGMAKIILLYCEKL